MARRRTISKHLRVQVLARDAYKCRMCGRSSQDIALEVDHIIPVAQGGTDQLNNLASLCKECNAGKSDFRFTDSSNMSLVPDGLEDHFVLSRDDRIGNFDLYRLSLYFKQPGGTLTSRGQYEHSWKITDTERATSTDPTALEKRRRVEETHVFKEQIRRSVAEERRRLILTEEGVVKV